MIDNLYYSFYNYAPFIAIGCFAFFYRINNLNNLLVGLIFVSNLFFATNYWNLGFDFGFDIFRALHRLIGVSCAIGLFVYLFKNKSSIFDSSVLKILLLFFIVLLISSIGNELYFPYYFHYVRNFVFLSLIVLFLYYEVNTQEKVDELFKLIVFATLILSLMVFAGVFESGVWDRISIFYSNPNYLAIALFPGYVLTLFSKNKYSKIIALVIALAIVASASRAVEIGVVMATFLYLFKNRKLFNKVYVSIFLLVLVIITAIFFNKMHDKREMTNTRLVLAEISLNILKENIFNGIGYGQFRKKYQDYIDADILNKATYEITDPFFARYPNSPLLDETKYSKMSEGDKQNLIDYFSVNRNNEKMTHNDLLTITSELGVFGLSFLVYFLLKLYLELKKLLLHSKDYYYISISLIIGFLFFSLLHNNITSFVFWFILIIPFIINRNYKKQFKE